MCDFNEAAKTFNELNRYLGEKHKSRGSRRPTRKEKVAENNFCIALEELKDAIIKKKKKKLNSAIKKARDASVDFHNEYWSNVYGS